MNRREEPRGERMADHLDEMSGLLYLEGQLEPARARQVSAHSEECAGCRTLLRALERESRLLTRSMVEDDEPLPARLVAAPGRSPRSMQWLWGAVFGLAATGAYAFYSGYIEPWLTQLDQAGFGGTNLLGLLVFQGAFWKGWQSMFSLFETLALVIVAGTGLLCVRRWMRRSSTLAVILGGVCAAALFPAPAGAAELRHEQSYTLGKDEVIKNDLYVAAGRARIDGTVDGDLVVFGEGLDVGGHVTGDVIAFVRTIRITGQVDGNVRVATNTLTLSGSVGRNVTSATEVLDLDSSARIGGGLTMCSGSASLDGKIARDVFAMVGRTVLTGSVGGNLKMRGADLSVGPTAQIQGRAYFAGERAPEVSSQAKLASPVEFHKVEREGRARHAGHFIWRGIWLAATLLFGLVLFLLLPRFARETVESADHYGVSLGLGILVLCGIPVAAVLACVTIVGIPVGVAAMILWGVAIYCSQIVVGAVVGKWLLGPAGDTWALIARMALGLTLLKVAGIVPFFGGLLRLAVLLWGLGAISLVIYRQFESARPAGAAPTAA
ncbi:MAG: hypothetical protein LAN84_06065 [Acidobacteriia bacterium]|nr:hypothetical protein [Terriglobia bacterium]